ncbi:MBL fold metallo-hydrolase [Variovorax paradoxus]|uniref:MBL fold metallo-hydrolase n=1 Tax=Variovorax paradoxus TaxID=34073 RepID=UPI0027814F1D|nr:MBL fold metallo-hydrolase [Variovorax paradoxus]MDQ0589928.1 glyoxylase-like metal-dependent hydrolase (beta-lactamase superfamily II) [Variovorax paradoxus]
MTTPFASTADRTDQRPQVVPLAPDVYGYISPSDPNCGFVVGRDAVLAVDTTATPAAARRWLQEIREVTDKPVRYVFLTHYHAVRVMGAAAFEDAVIVASENTGSLIRERGLADFESEQARMPRLFADGSAAPVLSTPHMLFKDHLTLDLGNLKVEFRHLGRGHTAGDSVCRIPQAGVVFGGDLIENHCGIYCGDAYLGDWLQTLERLRALQPDVLVPGRGSPLRTPKDVADTIDSHKDFLVTLLATVRHGLSQGLDLKGCYRLADQQLTPRFGDWPVYRHVLPFDVARAFDELRGLEHPQIWTSEKDRQLWEDLA